MMFAIALCIILGFTFGYVMGKEDSEREMAIADAKRRHPSNQSNR